MYVKTVIGNQCGPVASNYGRILKEKICLTTPMTEDAGTGDVGGRERGGRRLVFGIAVGGNCTYTVYNASSSCAMGSGF